MTLSLQQPYARPVESLTGDLPDTFDHGPNGTECIEQGCITLLSMYNAGPYCRIHAERHEREVTEEAERIIARRDTRRHLPLEVRRERREAILRLVDEGRPPQEIAALYEVAPNTVRNIVGEARPSAAGEQAAA